MTELSPFRKFFTVQTISNVGLILKVAKMPPPESLLVPNTENRGFAESWIRGVMVSTLDFYLGNRCLIPRQVEKFINLKCSFRMRPWEILHARRPTTPAGPHPLCVKCCVQCYNLGH